MKFIVLAMIMAVAMANIHTGYLNKFEEALNNEVQNMTTDSMVNLLKNNFKVVGDVEEQFESLVKGNLLNPVKMNYMFVVEGQDQMQKQDQAKVQIQQTGQKLLDSIFNTNSQESLVRMTSSQFPKEKRVPFYYYKSRVIEEESNYEQDFGIKMERQNGSKSNFALLDQRTNKQVGKPFTLQKCIKENFAGASDYQFKKTGIYKISDASMSLEINEQNARDVEALMQDLCAVSKLSNMFTESASPNFVSFVLSYKTISDNALVQELVEKMINNAENNFAQKIGTEKVYGQTIIVEDLNQVQSQKVLGKVQPRVLAATKFAALDDQVTTTSDTTRQIQFWFSVVFIVTIFVTCVALFKMEIAKDSLLYAKFITNDVK